MRDAHADLMYVRSRVFTCVPCRQLAVLCTVPILQVPNFEFESQPSCSPVVAYFFFRLYLIKTNRGENEGQLLYDGAQITPGRTRSTVLYRFEHLVVNCQRSSVQSLTVAFRRGVVVHESCDYGESMPGNRFEATLN